MSVVDSSGWIEYFEDGPNAAAFAPAVEDIEHLIVPTLVVTEVSRWLRVHGRSALVDELLAVMARGNVVDLDLPTASLAGELGIRHRLPLADSIIYATGQVAGLEVWTQDRDFEGLPGVRYVPKQA